MASAALESKKLVYQFKEGDASMRDLLGGKGSGLCDLTQLAYGWFSRDDAEGKFLRAYIAEGILPADPFATIDTDGVGALVRMAATAGRETQPDIELGICGEHGGDPDSVAFFHQIGLDYVSCSPYRVPVARLAAARAAIRCDRFG